MRIFRRNKKHLRGVACGLGFVQQLRVHTNVLDGKRTPLIEKRLLLVSDGGNQTGERLFQVGFIESCLTGAQRSRDNKQRWLLLAQGVIPSCAVLCWPFCGARSNCISNAPTGVRSPSGVTFTVAFRLRSYS